MRKFMKILLVFLILKISIFSCFAQDCLMDSSYVVDVLKNDTISTYHYENGQIKKSRKNKLKSWDFDIEENFIYQNGLLKKKELVFFYKDGSTDIDSIIYSYENGKLVKEHEFRKDGNPFLSEIVIDYAYEEDSIKISKTFKLGTVERFSIINSDGTKWEYNDTKPPSRRKLVDKQNNPLQIERRTDNRWHIFSTFEYKYDDCKNMIEQVERNSKGEILKTYKFINFYKG